PQPRGRRDHRRPLRVPTTKEARYETTYATRILPRSLHRRGEHRLVAREPGRCAAGLLPEIPPGRVHLRARRVHHSGRHQPASALRLGREGDLRWRRPRGRRLHGELQWRDRPPYLHGDLHRQPGWHGLDPADRQQRRRHALRHLHPEGPRRGLVRGDGPRRRLVRLRAAKVAPAAATWGSRCKRGKTFGKGPGGTDPPGGLPTSDTRRTARTIASATRSGGISIRRWKAGRRSRDGCSAKSAVDISPGSTTVTP